MNILLSTHFCVGFMIYVTESVRIRALSVLGYFPLGNTHMYPITDPPCLSIIS